MANAQTHMSNLMILDLGSDFFSRACLGFEAPV